MPAAARLPLPAVPLGLRYMALGAFWFSVMSLLVKAVGTRLPSMEVVLARAVVTLALSWMLLRRARVRPWGTQPRRLLLRGLLGFGGLTCFYYGLTHLPIADATVLQYTNPVFTALLAALLLGEHVSRRELVAILTSFAGVLLVARPSALAGAAALPLVPVIVAVVGAFLSATAYVAVRSMGTSEHPLVVVFYLPLVSVPLSIPAVVPVWVWPTPLEWLGLLAVGVATQIAQVYMTRGLQLERAGRATAVGYLQVVFAAAWGLLLFGERPTAWTVGGTVLVLAGTLLLTRARREGGGDDAAVRRRAPRSAAGR